MVEILNKFLLDISNLLGSLYGLPGFVSVYVFCLGFGFALKRTHWFPNDAIPLIVILWGSVWNALIADSRGELPIRVWIVKNIVFGAVIGFLAWLTHYNRRKIPLLKGLFETTETTEIKKDQNEN